MFAYCCNNPINRKDATGEKDEEIVDDNPQDDLFPDAEGGIGYFCVDASQGTISLGQSPGGGYSGNYSSGNSYGIDVGNLKFSNTVNNHVGRPYQNSPLLVNEIIHKEPPVPDPQGTGALSWKVGGTFNGSSGHFELIIDQRSQTVWHIVFKSIK